jgi:hypothetical protein
MVLEQDWAQLRHGRAQVNAREMEGIYYVSTVDDDDALSIQYWPVPCGHRN